MFNSKFGFMGAAALLAGTAQAQQEEASSAAGVAGAAVVTLDNSALETVVVTGTKDLQIVRDLPQSISTISGADLTRENAVNLDSIAKRLANVKWNYGNSQTSNYSIRGVGKIGNNQAADPLVTSTSTALPTPTTRSPASTSSISTPWKCGAARRGLLRQESTLGALRITTRRPSFTRSTDFSIGSTSSKGRTRVTPTATCRPRWRPRGR